MFEKEIRKAYRTFVQLDKDTTFEEFEASYSRTMLARPDHSSLERMSNFAEIFQELTVIPWDITLYARPKGVAHGISAMRFSVSDKPSLTKSEQNSLGKDVSEMLDANPELSDDTGGLPAFCWDNRSLHEDAVGWILNHDLVTFLGDESPIPCWTTNSAKELSPVVLQSAGIGIGALVFPITSDSKAEMADLIRSPHVESDEEDGDPPFPLGPLVSTQQNFLDKDTLVALQTVQGKGTRLTTYNIVRFLAKKGFGKLSKPWGNVLTMTLPMPLDDVKKLEDSGLPFKTVFEEMDAFLRAAEGKATPAQAWDYATGIG